MRSLRLVASLLAVTVGVVGCGDDTTDEPSPTPSPSATTETPTPTPSATPTPTPTPSATPTPTPSPTATADPCAPARDAAVATIDSSVEAARLTPVVAWSTDVTGSVFAARTTTAAGFAERLGFDCGLLATEVVGDHERLVIAAWTGPRMAWVVQTDESPTTPYVPDAMVTVLIGETQGEFLDGDTRAVWAGTLANGDTFVVGHVDYNLGAAAKVWFVEEPPTGDDEYDLASERHAVAVLEAAGMREIGIAQSHQIGSAEGYVMFVSPTGQISVADVAPVGWFDPLVPRYYDGETRIETIAGVEVRVTEPGPDAPDYAVAAELGFTCDGFVWLLEPPMNGSVDEALASASAILTTAACSDA